MTDELYEKIKPFLIEDYRSVAYKSGITLEDYLRLRKHEMCCVEIRYPGMSKYYSKKIRKFKILGWCARVVGTLFILSRFA